MDSMHYNDKFYSVQRTGSYDSACEMVPALLDLITPESVLDVGCGLGTWLKVFEENGVKDIKGIDGDYVKEEELFIGKSDFVKADLTKPIDLGRKFGLAISLEVGEHIVGKSSDVFFQNIIRHSDIVFFSAAIPGQGGTNHINEQWQKFWADKFINAGYLPIDTMRRKFWTNETVQTHYIQNALLFVKKSVLEQNINLQHEAELSRDCMISVVHPKTWLSRTDINRLSVREQWKTFSQVFFNSIKKRILK